MKNRVNLFLKRILYLSMCFVLCITMCLTIVFPASASESVYIDGAATLYAGTGAGFAGGVLAPNGKVILVPRNSPNVGIYDHVNDTYTKGVAHGKGTDAFYGGILAPNGKIIFSPFNSANIGIYDPVANTYTNGPAHGKGTAAFIGAILAPNGKIIFIPYYSTNIGIYDPVANTYTNGPVHGKVTGAFVGAVLASNGKIILVPANSTNIGIYDPVTNTYTNGPAHGKGKDAFNEGILAPNGKIILVPRNSPNVGIYDPITNIYTDGATHNKGQLAFVYGLLAPNGKIIFAPYNSANVGIYDPIANTYSDGATHGKGEKAFNSAVLATNGKILFMPSFSPNIGIYTIPADTAALAALIAQAKAKQNTGYTQSSWDDLQSQILAAESVLADTNKMQEQVDNARTALQAALDALEAAPSTYTITVIERYIDNAYPEKSTEHEVEAGQPFNTSFDVPDRYNVSSVSVMTVGISVDIDNRTINIDEVKQDITITLLFSPKQQEIASHQAAFAGSCTSDSEEYLITVGGAISTNLLEGTNNLSQADILKQKINVFAVNTNTFDTNTMPLNSIDSLQVVVENGIVVSVKISGHVQTPKGTLDTYTFETTSMSQVIPDTPPEIVYTKINDNHSSITYSGTWSPYSGDSAFYDGDESYSGESGAYAELSFEGTSVKYIGATSDNLGICDIYVDDVLVEQNFDLYSASLESQKVLFSATGLSNSQHTLKIVVTGQKNPLSSNSYVTIDAFEFG